MNSFRIPFHKPSNCRFVIDTALNGMSVSFFRDVIPANTTSADLLFIVDAVTVICDSVEQPHPPTSLLSCYYHKPHVVGVHSQPLAERLVPRQELRHPLVDVPELVVPPTAT